MDELRKPSSERSMRTHEGGVSRMRTVEPIARRMLDIQEVATYTGLSVHTVYAMVNQRRIPFVKLGRLVKFDRCKIDKWIEQNSVMPMPVKLN